MNSKTALEAIKAYIVSLEDPKLEQDWLRAMNKLRKENPKATFPWLLKALTIKDKINWKTYGFGLLFDEGYQAQVDKILEREKQHETLTWDMFDEE
jgi:hypothetical protein